MREMKVKLIDQFLHYGKLSFACIMACILCVIVPDVSAQQQDSDIQINTLFVGNISMEELARGEKGNGILLYFLPQRGPDQPSLAVRFHKDLEADIAVAEVFDVPSGMNRVPVQIKENQIVIDPTLTPVIIIKALGGWWVRNEVVNYNLDVKINGPVYAMWGGGYNSSFGPTRWTALVNPGESAVSINVRDPKLEGIPEWDLRQALKPLAGRAEIRINYAERKCKSPVSIDFGVFPLWPYVAESGAYELANGQLRPPIVVDWEKGKITHFSELVTVRNQNCSYALYSISNIVPEKVNTPNFETPFAFYDLSGRGKGFPNLILRTARFPAGDPWSTGVDVEIQSGQPVPKDIETVRYSWRNTLGDGLWDYKVEVLGFHPYTFETTIAGDLYSIDAPPYDQFPEWVIKQSWPVVTFIDTEGNSYSSNEGIYDWSPREVGIGYIFGWEDESKPQAFSDIYPGFRGEYRFRKKMPPNLYLSPIDNRLHLLGAEAGLWNLGEGLVLYLRNLDKGRYINGWVRVRKQVPIESTEQPVELQPIPEGAVEEALYALAGHLIYSGAGYVELRHAVYQSAKFEILPPTDKTSWRLFSERLAPYDDQKRDPKDLKSWLNPFPGKTLRITRAKISDLRALSNGFRLVLDLRPGFVVQQNNLFDVSALKPGRYVVIYNGRFTVELVTPAVLSISLATPKLSHLEQNDVKVTLRNNGLEDFPQVALELWATSPDGTTSVVTTQTIQLLAGEPVTSTLLWAPTVSGSWILTPKIRQPNGALISGAAVSVVVSPSPSSNPLSLFFLSTPPWRTPLILLTLIVLATLTAVVFWRHWGKPLVKRDSQKRAAVLPNLSVDIGTRCPICQAQAKQSRAGFNHSGSQKYRCSQCKRTYTPNPRPRGYPADIRILAMKMHSEGYSYKTIARILNISPSSVGNWVRLYSIESTFAGKPISDGNSPFEQFKDLIKQKQRRSDS